MRNNSITGRVVALIVVCILAVGICCAGFASRNDDGKWFKNSNLSTWHWADKVPELDGEKPDTDGNTVEVAKSGYSVLSMPDSNSISLMSAVIPRESYTANAISTYADSAYTLTIEVKPDGATDSFEWTISGNDDGGVTLTPMGMSATIECVKAFGVQKVITVTSMTNPALKATCTVDYYKRLQSVSLNAPTTLKLSTASTDYSVSLTPVYSEGTILDTTVTMSSLTVKVSHTQILSYNLAWNGMQANCTGSVTGNASTGKFSLIMSPSAVSSFFVIVKGAGYAAFYAEYFKWFVSNINSFPNSNHYEISANWYATRNGGTFNNGTATVQGKFDVSALIVDATDVTISDTNIIF